MSFSSSGTANPGKLDVLGAGYVNWVNPANQVAGVGRLTMPNGTPGLPDGTPGLGHVPVFDGRIDISALPTGTYVLELVQEGHAINVLRGDVDLTQSAGSFATRADVTPNTSISFVIDRGDDASDIDDDGVSDADDNCPSTANSNQADGDNDGVGDVCDNCPDDANADQADENNDGIGDVCDADDEPLADSDADTVPDIEDQCPGFDDRIDNDNDGIPNGCDNCPGLVNPEQTDGDNDGAGNACDACPNNDDTADADSDGIPDGCDNCPEVKNADQADADNDGAGDACDETGDDPVVVVVPAAPGPCGAGLVETGLISFLTLCVVGMSRRRRI
jgi:hypothetical protein